MTIVAIANVLFDGRMRARFHAEPIVQATELLLQERTPRDVSVAHPRAEEVKASARISDSRAADGATSAHDPFGDAANPHSLERPICRDAHQCGLRVQQVERYRCDALARRCHARRFRQLLLRARCRRAPRCGRRVFNRAVSSPTATKSRSPRTAPNSSAPMRRLPRRWRWSSPPRKTRKSAGSRLRTPGRPLASSISLLTANSRSRRRRPIRRIRRSRSSSWKHSSSQGSACCWQRVANARPMSRRSGPRTMSSSRVKR